MSRFMDERFAELKAYVPGEQPRDKKYIKLNTNESPYPPSPAVADVLNVETVADLRLYGDPVCADLKRAIGARLGVSEDCVFVGNGSDEVLSFAFMAFCGGKTGVSYPDISYGFYPVYADLYNLRKNVVPLQADFSISAKDYYGARTTIVIANPNAPTGLCLSIADVEDIVIANPDNVVVIDEAYVDYGGESCVTLTDRYDNLLVVQTFSKSRSLAGARLGFAIGNPSLIADLEKLRYSTNPFNINRLSMLAGIAALHEQSYYDKVVANIIQTREKFAESMRRLGFFITESCGNFLFASHSKVSGRKIYQWLRERGILVRHFAAPRIDNFVRITVGTPEQMKTLVEALEEIVNNA